MKDSGHGSPKEQFAIPDRIAYPIQCDDSQEYDPDSFESRKELGIFAGLGQYVPERVQDAG